MKLEGFSRKKERRDKMLQFSKRTREPEDETLELIEEIRNTRERLTRIDRWFALEDDEDLIDACIYEREAGEKA